MTRLTVTGAMLRAMRPRPCEEQVAQFEALFPTGADLTMQNLRRVQRSGINAEFLVRDDPAYRQAVAPALAAYRQAEAAALAAYEQAEAAALLAALRRRFVRNEEEQRPCQ
jgi:hypothetical protein